MIYIRIHHKNFLDHLSLIKMYLLLKGGQSNLKILEFNISQNILDFNITNSKHTLSHCQKRIEKNRNWESN